MHVSTFLIWITLAWTVNEVSSTYFQTEADYYTRLVSLYTVNNRSMSDFLARVSNRSVDLTVHAGLLALQDLDEVDGTLELMIYLNIDWTDSIVQASGYNLTDLFPDTTEVSYLTVPFGSIWTPKLLLANSVASLKAIGNAAFQPRFDLLTANVNWIPRVNVRSACSPDVTYYPFDTQTCKFSFIPLGYRNTELNFVVKYQDWDMSLFEKNGEWDVIRTQASSTNRKSISWLELSITVSREPLYHAFNIILPILVLIVLNGMVFWLPVESGERIGFSITCFLSFVVLLNMIMDILPRSSSPMSLLCYYTVCMMMFSGLTTTIVILEMRLFHKPEKEHIPKWIQKVVRFLQCQSCKRSPAADNEVAPEVAIVKRPLSKKAKAVVVKDAEEENDELTWAEFTRFLDKFLFLAFVGGQTFFTILFIIPLAASARN